MAFHSWKKVSLLTHFFKFGSIKKKDLILEDTGITIRFNDTYDGLAYDTTYLDSPILQWVLLILSIFALSLAVPFFSKKRGFRNKFIKNITT